MTINILEQPRVNPTYKQVAREAKQESQQNRLIDMLDSRFNQVLDAQRATSDLTIYLKGKVDILENRR